MPIAYHTDDSALPLVALAILFAALAPPLSFGVVSVWDSLRPTSDAAETRALEPRASHGAKHGRRASPRRGGL